MSDDLGRLAADVIAALKDRGWSLATAEATTGGLIGHLLTAVPGSSGVFRGGMAPYSNDAKLKLGVSKDVFEQYGAVSGEAAEALAAAVRSWVWADIGLAETGIAGPTGGSEERPVGIFWIAVLSGSGARIERFDFGSDREGNMRSCAEAALRMVVEAAR